MSLLCNCPVGAALGSVPLSDCPNSLGQIQKVVFQRVFSTGATRNSFTIASANPNVKASWTPLLAATDGTKVVQSPYLSAPAFEAGAARTYGGGNETLGGIEIILGREATAFTGNILRAPQTTIKALKAFMCENVGVYLIDEFGRITGTVDNTTTPTKFYPIPISALFVGDKAIGGLETPDMNALTWKFLPNWSDNLHTVVPTDFDALTELLTPA